MPKSPIRTRLCVALDLAECAIHYATATYPFENRIVWLHNMQGYRRSNSTESCGQQQKGTCMRRGQEKSLAIHIYFSRPILYFILIEE